MNATISQREKRLDRECIYFWQQKNKQPAPRSRKSGLFKSPPIEGGKYIVTRPPCLWQEEIRAAARSVLLIGRVKREPNVRVVIHDKSSLAPEGKPVAFCLDPETGFSWIGEYDITADELLSGAGGNNATKTEQAEKLILDLLADGKELASEDIEKAAADAGISARTVRAAKKNLDGRITSKRIGAAWYHALKK